MQPTTLCNLDCVYCYLPDRRSQKLMPVVVAERVAHSIVEQDSPHSVATVWHGGEPATAPLAHFRALLVPFESLRQVDAIVHHVQTNATLISSQRCDLIDEYGTAAAGLVRDRATSVASSSISLMKESDVTVLEALLDDPEQALLLLDLEISQPSTHPDRVGVNRFGNGPFSNCDNWTRFGNNYGGTVHGTAHAGAQRR